MADTALDPAVAALDPVLSGGVAQQQSGPPGASLDPTVAALDPVLSGAQVEDKQPKPGEIPDPIPQWSGSFQQVADHWKIGMSAVSKASQGWQLATTDKNFDDAQKEFADKELVQAMANKEEFARTHGFWDAAHIGDMVGGGIIESIPTLGMSLAGGLLAAPTAAIAGPLGPLLGGASVFGALSYGQQVYDLMQRGLSKEDAKVAALPSGIGGIVVGMLGGGGTKSGITSVAGALENPAIKAKIYEASVELAKSTGVQVGSSLLNTLIDSVVKLVATRSTEKPYTIQEAQDAMKETALQTFAVAPFLAAGTAGGAKVVNHFATHAEAARALQAHLETKAELFKAEQAEKHAKMLEGGITLNQLGDQLTAEAKKLQAHQDKVLTAAEAYQEKVADPDYRASVVQQVVDASRVLPGAAKKVLAAAKKAKAEGREITPEEQAALDREIYLSLKPHQAKKRLENMLRSQVSKRLPWTKDYGYEGFTQGGKLTIALQDVPNPEPLVEALDTQIPVEHALTLQRQYDDAFYNHLSAATGLKRGAVTDLAHKATTTIIEGVYKGSERGKDGAPRLVDEQFQLSADEIISYLMWMENADAQAALFEPHQPGTDIGNGFTNKRQLGPSAESTEKVFLDVLEEADPNFVRMLEGYRAFYDEMGPKLQQSAMRINGEEIGLQQNYGGSIYRSGARERVPKDLEPFMPGTEIEYPGESAEQAAPGFTLSRGPSKVRIEPRGAAMNASNRIRQQAQWEAMAVPARLWTEIMQNKTFKRAIETKFENGRKLFESIEAGYLDTVHGSPAVAKAHNKFVDNMMRARTVAKLGLKPQQTLKHIMTTINFLLVKHDGQFLPPGELVKGALKFYTSKKARDFVFKLDEVKNRYTHVDQIAVATKPGTTTPTQERITKASMVPFELGDKPALGSGVLAVYDWVLGKTGSEEKARAAAIAGYKSVLAGGTLDQLSDISKQPIMKLFGQFKQPERRLAEHVMQAQRKAANFPTAENIQAAIHTRIISHLAAGLFVLPDVLVASGLAAVGLKEAEYADEAWFRFWQRMRLGNMWWLMSDIAVSLDTVFQNMAWNEHHHVWEPSEAVSEAGAKTVAAGTRALKIATGQKDLTLQEALKLFLEVNAGPLTIGGAAVPETPVKAVKDWLEAIYGKDSP